MTLSLPSLLSGDRRTLAKAITLCESTLAQDRAQALKLLGSLPSSSKSKRYAISGPPGVGKSSFLEVFGKHLLRREPSSKIAILAIDPSSPQRGGSILADKTRMSELSQDERVFIRPSPSGSSIHGVTDQTQAAILLCEAAGFHHVLIETVGIGQSQTKVANLVDVFIVLQQPNAGDELQAIKKGLIELADFLLVTKADGDSLAQAKKTFALFKESLHDQPRDTRIHCLSSHQDLGFGGLFDDLDRWFKEQISSGGFTERRGRQALIWFEAEVLALLEKALRSPSPLNELFLASQHEFMLKSSLPPLAAELFLQRLLDRLKGAKT